MAAPPDQPITLAALARETALAVAVAAVLLVPFIGLRGDTSLGANTIITRWPEAIAACLLTGMARLLLAALAGGRAGLTLGGGAGLLMLSLVVPWPNMLLATGAAAIGGLSVLAGAWRLWRGAAAAQLVPIRLPPQRRLVMVASVALFVLAVMLPLTGFADRRLIDTATLAMIYLVLAWGLNIVTGLAGLLVLGFAGFYAIGAYAYAILAPALGFWAAVPVAGLSAALAGLLLGLPVLRLRGDYLAIVTLGFGEIVRIVAINWPALTGGSEGIGGIVRPDFFGLAVFERRPEDGVAAFHQLFGLDFDSMHRLIFLYYLLLALIVLLNAVILRLRRLPIGRAWEALREDEIACQALGIDRTGVKLSAFAVAAFWGGVAGAFFAARQGFISPESFQFLESAIVLAIVVLGGMGSQFGILLAAIVLIGLPEYFRELQEYRMLVFGAGMIAVMLWRPRGLLSLRTPSVLLRQRGDG